MPMEKLTEEQKDKVAIMLQFSKKLQDAYLLKEYFHEFMQAQSSAEAKEKLHKFRLLAATVQLEEFDICLRVLENWEPYILNAFDARLSNGFTEGTNNLIKVIKRIGFGFRNFDHFRKRILLVANQ